MAERRYSKTHEWVTVDGKTATVGISDFAQAQLGDVVFLDLPKPGRKVGKGETFGVIESVKAASDLYSPVNGTVAAVRPHGRSRLQESGGGRRPLVDRPHRLPAISSAPGADACVRGPVPSSSR